MTDTMRTIIEGQEAATAAGILTRFVAERGGPGEKDANSALAAIYECVHELTRLRIRVKQLEAEVERLGDRIEELHEYDGV